MTKLYVFIDTNAFGVKNVEAVTAIRSALEVYNQKILQEQCRIEDFCVVETNKHKNANVIVTLNKRKHKRMNLPKWVITPPIGLVYQLSCVSDKSIILDLESISQTALDYDKITSNIISECVCRELCCFLGMSYRESEYRYGSKESQADFGLMLTPYSQYNIDLGKEYFLTETEVNLLKSAIAAKVA